MAYKVKNPKNVFRIADSLRRAEIDIQNILSSSKCPQTIYNATLAQENLSIVHSGLNQMARDLGVDIEPLIDGATLAWPGGGK